MSNSLWVIIEGMVFLFLVLPFILSIKYTKTQRLYLKSNKYNSLIPFYLIIILSICLFDKTGGDYFHYKEQLKDLQYSPGLGTGLENIYIWIATKVQYSYCLFRFIVWGAAITIYWLIIKHLRLNKIEAIWIFLLVYLFNFSYPRISLALCIFYYGYIIIVANHKVKKILIAIALIITSCFFHKTIILLVALSIIAIVIPINRMTILIGILIFPILVYLTNLYIGDYIYIDNLNNTTTRYLSAEKAVKGLSSIIQDILLLVPFFFFLVSFLKDYLKDKLPQPFKGLFKITLVILYASSILYFMEIGDNAISFRIRSMAIMPICLLITFHIKHKQFTTLNLFCYLSLLLYNIYYILYMYYLKTIGLGI